jgi:hypothetical protein
MILKPFFSFFGSKWRLAPEYPPPQHDTIIEPFAGSAGYSLHHPEREIILIERDPIIAAIWRWLISADVDDISSLPILKAGGKISDYDLPQEAKWLMGFWVNQATTRPCDTVTDRADNPGNAMYLSKYVKRASQLHHIRHWQVVEGDYTLAPDIAATWFVDPPYQVAGKKYHCGSSGIDYATLGGWCRSRQGQTIVCENDGASWLPFQPFREQKGSTYRGKARYSTEVVYLQ